MPLTQDELANIWEKLTSPIEKVYDEDGVNMAEATIRKITDDLYLYEDNVDGYDIISAEWAAQLLTREESEED